MIKILLILIIIFYLIYENKFFKVDKKTFWTDKVNEPLKIIQVSDFHLNKLLNLKKIRKKLFEINPDLIVVTGDVINRHSKPMDIKEIEKFFKNINIGKDIIFVDGNHEFENKNYDILKNILMNNNIKFEKEFYEIKNYRIYRLDYGIKKEFTLDKNFYNILLIHDPLNYIYNLNHNFDLVISGHIHGGQIRVPLIGALIDSNYNLFPKYSKGVYNIDDSKIYINVGLGSKFYIRVFNRCEISLIEVNHNT